MKNKLLLMVMIPLLLLLFVGCENPDSKVAPSNPSDPVKKVFLGGSILVDPERPDINQLLPGMQLPVRMAKYEQASDGSPTQIADSVKYGVLTIQTVDYAKLVFTLKLKNSTGAVIINNVTVTLDAGSSYDIDNDGFNDITYQKSDRAGALKTMYLTFISSQADYYTTMYQLLPEYFPAGNYPSGLAGISPSGRLIIKQSDAALQGTLSPALTSLLRDGDIIINTAAAANEGRVKEVSTSQGSIQGAGYSYIIDADQDLMQKAYEICYIDAHGLVSKLVDSSPASRANATIHIIDITQSISAEINDAISVEGTVGIDLDFYIDVTIDTFFVGVEFRVSMYAIAKTSLAGKIEVSAVMDKLKDKKIISIGDPIITIDIGIPIELSCPVDIYLDIDTKEKLSITFSEENETRMGFEDFHAKGWMDFSPFSFGPHLNVDPPKPVISNNSKIDPPDIYFGIEPLCAFIYIKLSPEIAPCWVAHIKSPIETGFEFNSSIGKSTAEGPTVKVDLNFLTKFGIITGSVGIDRYQVDLGKIDLGIEYKLNLWEHIFYQTPEPTPLPTPLPNTIMLSVSRGGTGSGTVTSSPTGIDCGSTCSSPFSNGTVVTLTAVANYGSSFAGWSGAVSGTGTSCQVTMDNSKSVTANFNTIPLFQLTVNPAGQGSGNVVSTPAGINWAIGEYTASFSQGTTVTLTAYPYSGSTFAGWSGAASGNGTSCQVTMDAAKSVTATFIPTPTPTPTSPPLTTFMLTVTVNRAGGDGTVTSSPSGINCGTSCSTTFTRGTVVTLTAAPNASSNFAGWSGAASGTATTCTVTMDQAKSVTAVFTP